MIFYIHNILSLKIHLVIGHARLKRRIKNTRHTKEKMIAIKKPDKFYVAELSAYLNHYQETTLLIRNNLYHLETTYQDAPSHGESYGSFENNQLKCILASIK